MSQRNKKYEEPRRVAWEVIAHPISGFAAQEARSLLVEMHAQQEWEAKLAAEDAR